VGRSLLAVILGCVTLLIIAPTALGQSGVIVGEVTEFAGNKLPLGGITVSAFRDNGQLAASTTTTAIGGYVIPGLAPGKYRVEFFGAGFVPRYYNEAVWFSEAKPVTIAEEGEVQPNINAGLRRAGAIAGRVTDAATKFPVANVSVKATNTTLASFPSRSV
jgi:hypothetical protein